MNEWQTGQHKMYLSKCIVSHLILHPIDNNKHLQSYTTRVNENEWRGSGVSFLYKFCVKCLLLWVIVYHHVA